MVSGGDAYMLPAAHLSTIGHLLLAIPHIRRIRIATKGPAVSPMKILTDDAWVSALFDITNAGRAMGKEVCLHTHFNSPSEITEITRQAMEVLFKGGVTVRNALYASTDPNCCPSLVVHREVFFAAGQWQVDAGEVFDVSAEPPIEADL